MHRSRPKQMRAHGGTQADKNRSASARRPDPSAARNRRSLEARKKFSAAFAKYDHQLASYTRCCADLRSKLEQRRLRQPTHPANSTRIWFRYLLRPWKSAQHHRRPGGRDCGRSPSAADYRPGHRPIASSSTHGTWPPSDIPCGSGLMDPLMSVRFQTRSLVYRCRWKPK